MTTTDPTRSGGYPAADGTAADVPPAPRGPAPGAERAADPTTAPPATPGETRETAWDRVGIREALGILRRGGKAPGLATQVATLLDDFDRLAAEVRRLRGELAIAPPADLHEDVAYLVFRAVDVGDASRAAALEVADQILARVARAADPAPATKAVETLELRWDATRSPDLDGLSDALAHVGVRLDWAFVYGPEGGRDELVLRLNASTPDVYRLPAEPPTEVAELWDKDGDHWERYDEEHDAGWVCDMSETVLYWAELITEYGPLSTTPPAGTEGER